MYSNMNKKYLTSKATKLVALFLFFLSLSFSSILFNDQVSARPLKVLVAPGSSGSSSGSVTVGGSGGVSTPISQVQAPINPLPIPSSSSGAFSFDASSAIIKSLDKSLGGGVGSVGGGAVSSGNSGSMLGGLIRVENPSVEKRGSGGSDTGVRQKMGLPGKNDDAGVIFSDTSSGTVMKMTPDGIRIINSLDNGLSFSSNNGIRAITVDALYSDRFDLSGLTNINVE